MTDTEAHYLPLPSKLSRVLRVAGRNALPVTTGLVLIAFVRKTYIRLTTPFMTEAKTSLFDPEIGILYTPYRGPCHEPNRFLVCIQRQQTRFS